MASAALAGTTTTAGAAPGGHDPGNAFQQVNLVSDVFELAEIQDTAVINPWGIAMGPHTPLWVNNNTFSPDSQITLYKGATRDGDPIEKVRPGSEMAVTASVPTGIVFNPTKSFVIDQEDVKGPATFLFNETNETAGEITGWSKANPQFTKTTPTDAKNPGAFYGGLALVPGKSGNRGKDGPHLLAANNIPGGGIDVYDGEFTLQPKTSAFVDPNTKTDGIPPYNVTFLKDRVYVTYFDTFNFGTPSFRPGSALSVFTPEGKFIKRLVDPEGIGNPLNAPWGMAIAPNNWGDFGGAILVGNVLSGEINAFNRRNGHLLGTLKDADNNPLVNGGLWGLAFGNGTIGTPRTLLFSAGIGPSPDDLTFETLYSHGLIGLIKPVNDKP